jgi:hypothetical protein
MRTTVALVRRRDSRRQSQALGPLWHRVGRSWIHWRRYCRLTTALALLCWRQSPEQNVLRRSRREEENWWLVRGIHGCLSQSAQHGSLPDS